MTRNPGYLTPNLTFLVLGHSPIHRFVFCFFFRSPPYHHPISSFTSRAQVTAREGEVLKGLLMEATVQSFIGSGSPARDGLY